MNAPSPASTSVQPLRDRPGAASLVPLGEPPPMRPLARPAGGAAESSDMSVTPFWFSGWRAAQAVRWPIEVDQVRPAESPRGRPAARTRLWRGPACAGVRVDRYEVRSGRARAGGLADGRG